jgi:hypothetical protein
MFCSRKRQHGFAAMVMVVLITMIALSMLISKTGEWIAGSGRRASATNDTQSQIHKAMVSFAGTYGRLPCPAAPTGALNPGWPNDIALLAVPASSTCTYTYGVVPWKVLGLSQEQVSDEWGRLISYRVYDGQFGLTQDKGASALNCDTKNLSSADVEPTATGLCNNLGGTHNTLRRDFITYTTFGTTPSFDKGVNVADFGSNVPNVAYVLISHGASGLGGYLPNGVRMSMPAIDAGDFANTQTSPSAFVRRAASDTNVLAGANGHYDDIVSYRTIADLLRQAGQEAREWGDITFDANTTANMTIASSDPNNPHFITTAKLGSFVAVASSTGVTGGAVEAGAVAGSYASCLWWPSKMDVVAGTLRSMVAASVEFAAEDNPSDSFPGFTLGFLAGTTAPTNETCGTTTAATTGATVAVGSRDITVTDTTGIILGMNAVGVGIDVGSTVSSITGQVVRLNKNAVSSGATTVSFSTSRQIRRDLGWAGGTLATYPNRFAAEFDATADSGTGGPPAVGTASDPNRPHLAIDLTGVVHGTDASSCATVGSGLPCDSEATSFPATSKTATGTSGTALVVVSDVAGIAYGMNVTGSGIGSSARVLSISGTSVTLSVVNSGSVSGIINFGAQSTANFMQNGLAVFHNARVEVSPNDCVAPTGTGLINGSSITVASNTGISSGMSAYGIGVASGATVTGVSGTTVTLSATNTAAVSGTITFGGSATASTSATGTAGQNTLMLKSANGIAVGMVAAGSGINSGATVQSFSGTTVTLSAVNTGTVSGTVTFTPVSALTRTLLKAWTLSNAGCNESSILCAAIKNTSVKFTSDISTNRQAMHAVSCIPTPTVANAYDSLYFGITTANRDTNSAGAANVKFQGLSVRSPSLP